MMYGVSTRMANHNVGYRGSVRAHIAKVVSYCMAKLVESTADTGVDRIRSRVDSTLTMHGFQGKYPARSRKCGPVTG